MGGDWEVIDDGGGRSWCGETLTCKRKLGYAKYARISTRGIGVSQENPIPPANFACSLAEQVDCEMAIGTREPGIKFPRH